MSRYHGKRVSRQWRIVLNEAERDGVLFTVNSGRRTMAEQWRLVRQKGVWSPSNPHGAARPAPWAPHIRVGRQDHALDIDTGGGGETRLQGWLVKHHAAAVNTVPGEPWHLEVPRGQLRKLARRIAKRRKR